VYCSRHVDVPSKERTSSGNPLSDRNKAYYPPEPYPRGIMHLCETLPARRQHKRIRVCTKGQCWRNMEAEYLAVNADLFVAVAAMSRFGPRQQI
jgi:hypothetical protein